MTPERRRVLAETAQATAQGIAVADAMWTGQTVRGELLAQLDRLAAIRRENGVDSPAAEAIAAEAALDEFCGLVLPWR